MLGSNALETAIGLVFIYLLLSLVCTVINEAISSKLEQRGKTLLEGIKNLLNDPEFTNLAQHVYNHGLIDGVMQGATDFSKANRLPSYIAPTNFALALIDILGSSGAGQAAVVQMQKELAISQTKSAADPTNESLKTEVTNAQAALNSAISSAAAVQAKYADAREAAKQVKKLEDFGKVREASETLHIALSAGRAIASMYPDPLGSVQEGIDALAAGHTKQSLLTLLDQTKREMAVVAKDIRTGEVAVEKLRENLEGWFNDAMDRFTGWYKRWTRQISFAVAVVVVVVANADTITLANRLTRDAGLRAGIIVAADNAISKNQTARQALLDDSEKLNLPLGWIGPHENGGENSFGSEQIPASGWGWLSKIFGLLISALAVSLGAPFWFDTLSKFMNVRGAGKVPDTSQPPSK